jgi:hypothetical protein
VEGGGFPCFHDRQENETRAPGGSTEIDPRLLEAEGVSTTQHRLHALDMER